MGRWRLVIALVCFRLPLDPLVEGHHQNQRIQLEGNSDVRCVVTRP